MDAMTGLVAYLGPETMLPMTSVIAGIVGVVLMLGRNTWGLILGLFRIKGGSTRAKAKAKRAGINAPHVRVTGEPAAGGEAGETSAATRAASTPLTD